MPFQRGNVALAGLLAMLATGCGDDGASNEEPTADGGTGRPVACGFTDAVDPIVGGLQRACSLPDCACDGAFRILGPDLDELGTFAAAEIDVPTTPFDVQAIGYFTASTDDPLPAGPRCEGAFPQEVQLYVEPDSVPSCEPMVARAFSTEEVAAASGGCPERPEDRFFTRLRVDPPVRVEQGERLFVAVQLSGNAERAQCVRVCTDQAEELAMRSWVGETADPLCPWTPLSGMPGLEQLALDFFVEGASP